MKLTFCLVVMVPFLAPAQMTQQPTSLTQTTTGTNLPSMAIGPNDLLQIAVYQSPELSGSVRVDSQGFIQIPMVERQISAKGLYPRELEGRVAEALVSENLVVNPVVRVTIAEYQSRTVSVVGEVHHPLTFQAAGDVTLLDAIARAEGISSTAGDELLITEGQPHPGTVVRRVSIKDLMSGKSPELNLALQGGEEIRVPKQGRFSVVGNVRKPGQFSINRDDQPTVLNAVAESEGLTPYAGDRAYIYRAADTRQAKEQIPVDLHKIMERKAPDVALQAGDLLYIPDNRNKRITLGTLDKLFAAGSVTGSALVYAGVR
jgi:polysaccharide export outer membrane protein